MDCAGEMTWDGWCWQCTAYVAWLNGQPVNLTVHSGVQSEQLLNDAPPLSDEQLAAIRSLANPKSENASTLLAAIITNVPEICGADWSDALAVLELTDVIVLRTANHGLAYMAFIFISKEYEHGIGAVVHGERLVHFGFAEEVIEQIAEADLRKQKRKRD